MLQYADGVVVHNGPYNQERYLGRVNRHAPQITEEEQLEIIRNAKVLIVGTGGMGGWVARALQGLGVGTITVTDNGDFDLSNSHRQYGCMQENLNKNKALATQSELKRFYDTDVDIIADPRGMCEDSVDELLQNRPNVVLDLCEFFAPDARILTHLKTAELGIHVMNANVVGKGTHLFDFPPHKRMSMEEVLGMTYEESKELVRRHQAGDRVSQEVIVDAVMKLLPIYHEYRGGEYKEFMRRLKEDGQVSIIATTPMQSAGILANQVAKVLLIQAGVDLRRVLPLPNPGYVYFDGWNMEVRRFEGKWF